MENFWLYDILYYFKNRLLLEIWPNQYYSFEKNTCYNKTYNLFNILGYFMTKNINILVIYVINNYCFCYVI